jgi:hypothetical protein
MTPPLELLSVETIWQSRACFICARFGTCEHRELEVAQAIIEGHQQKQARLVVEGFALAAAAAVARGLPSSSDLAVSDPNRRPPRAIGAGRAAVGAA